MIRRRNQSVLVLFAVSALASFANADTSPGTHELEEGKVRFVCEGPQVTVPAWGQFGTVEGALSIDPRDLRKASGNIDVFMVSIRTDDSAWDTMFRRAGFLEIDDVPKSRFVLEAVRGAKKLEPGKWVPMTLEGRFALHGISKKVSVPATVRWTRPMPRLETASVFTFARASTSLGTSMRSRCRLATLAPLQAMAR